MSGSGMLFAGAGAALKFKGVGFVEETFLTKTKTAVVMREIVHVQVSWQGARG
jgi:hypothetical protein